MCVCEMASELHRIICTDQLTGLADEHIGEASTDILISGQNLSGLIGVTWSGPAS
jgi:hypothetical protein